MPARADTIFRRIRLRLATIALLGFGAAALQAETLRLATYNVENYVVTDRMVDGEYRQEYPKSEDAKRALRTVIRQLDADVVALQEMGPQPYLDELRRDLATDGVVYPYFALLDAADPYRHVAVLSRRPFSAVKKHADLAINYFGDRSPVLRGLLEVRLETDVGELAIFVVHLKSRYTDRKDDPFSAVRRAAEATAVRNRVLDIYPDPESACFAIVGDFNDSPRSRPVRALLQRAQTRIATMLPAADARGETWTHCYRKEDSYSRVDYILASPALVPRVQGGGARVWDTAETAAASDHRPVLVSLELGK